MAVKVVMPKMGLTMEEGSVVKWHKEEGEEVRKGELLLEILTDKATMEVEAPEDGTLTKIFVQAGQKVKVGKTIAVIAREGEDPQAVPDDAPGEPLQESYEPPTAAALGALPKPEEEGKWLKASPYARKLAAEFGLNLVDIPGSGPEGRITERDVMAQKNRRKTLASPLARKMAEEEGLPLSQVQGSGVHGKIMRKDVEGQLPLHSGSAKADEILPFTGMRKIIAERMESSAFSAPHVTLFKEVDVAGLVAARERILAAEPDLEGLSYTVFIAAMTARALTEYPEVNSRIEGDHIRRMSQVHVGIAVALDDGLVVPVIHHTAEWSVKELAAKARALIVKAKAGGLLPEEMQGGTFTVSNLGSLGIDGFTPIINQPECAILGLGRIIDKPAALEGQVVVRPMMTLSLSFDHRIVDGVPAARFLNRIAEYIHEPLLLL